MKPFFISVVGLVILTASSTVTAATKSYFCEFYACDNDFGVEFKYDGEHEVIKTLDGGRYTATIGPNFSDVTHSVVVGHSVTLDVAGPAGYQASTAFPVNAPSLRLWLDGGMMANLHCRELKSH